MKTIISFLILISAMLPFAVAAQEKCGTTLFNHQFDTNQSAEESKKRFESWLKEEISQKATSLAFQKNQRSRVEVLKVPVVVHVIHYGEDLGVGRNIPDEQIYSQIQTLNEDYRRTNIDQSETPPDFSDVSADVNIDFVLAKRDPEGLPTTGIVRVKGGKSKYSFAESELIAANSYWPAEDYLNIWVLDISGGYLGFAKFPISNLPGLDDDPNLNRLVDGAFIDYEYFGTGYNARDFSLGRTVTHEVGHWLGLRHTWGEGGCNVDDFCDDTPLQSGSTTGCPNVTKNTCSEDSRNDMFQNYMDYTDDVCMNLFTICQGDRMHAVLGSSPRRKSMLTSKGGVAPVEVANDLGIRSVQSPNNGICGTTFVPELEIRNYGTNEITSFKIDFLVDGFIVETVAIDQSLDLLDIAFISFSSITVSSDAQEMSFQITAVNETVDGNSENDSRTVSTYFPEPKNVPFFENFTGFASNSLGDWSIKNDQNNPSAWGFTDAPNGEIDNVSAVLNYFGGADEVFGELDYLISPVFDFSGMTTMDMSFKYAYSGISDKFSDALKVVVSTDCGRTFPQENILFESIGVPLQTVGQQNSSYVPSGSLDWRQVNLELSDYVEFSEVIIAFVGSNGTGNQLYLDDIELFSLTQNEYDIELTSINQLPIVTCEAGYEPSVIVRNLGKVNLNSFVLEYDYGTSSETKVINGLDVLPGESVAVDLTIDIQDEGEYLMSVAVDLPNGEIDENSSNNQQKRYFNLDFKSAEVPNRERFDHPMSESLWNFIRSDTLHDWRYIALDDRADSSLIWNGYDSTTLGNEHWLVSPMLDLEGLDAVSVFFDISYANRLSSNDQLQVFGSKNCGESFNYLLYSKKGGELAVTQSENAWVPTSDQDWKREYVNMDAIKGFPEARIAFVITNQNGNNIYLDNIEFFLSDDESPIVIEEPMRVFPNPASNYVEVKFNFEIKETVTMSLLSLTGSVIVSEVFENVLNQQYRLDNLPTNNGMYILHVRGGGVNESRKVMISN